MEVKLCCILSEYYTCDLCGITECKPCWEKERSHVGEPGGRRARCFITSEIGTLTGREGTPMRILKFYE